MTFKSTVVNLGGRILTAKQNTTSFRLQIQQNTTSLHQSAQSNSAHYTGAYMQKETLNDTEYYKHLQSVGNHKETLSTVIISVTLGWF